jgi:hypothetical protein
MLGIGFTSNIRYNLKQYLEKLFLDNAFYTNTKRGYTFYDGSNPAQLTRVGGRYYESMANEWAYETDITVPSGSKGIIAVSGAWVNGAFHANGSATYNPAPDYLRGRIVFGTAPPANATVEAEFSAKDVKVDFQDSKINNILMTKYLHNPDFWSSTAVTPSGVERLLPAVIIEPLTRGHRPRQIGGGKILRDRVSVFVYAARDYERDVIADAVFSIARNVISAVDYGDAGQILDYNGDYAATYQNFTQLQASAPWTRIYIDEAEVAERNLFVNIYQARVDLLLRIYLNS